MIQGNAMAKNYVCPVCHEWVSTDPHACSGVAIPSLTNMWGLPTVAAYEMNAYTFPDLAGILDQLDTYILSLSGKPGWPALSKTLKLAREVTAPGMMLVLGNPKNVDGKCVAQVLNAMLPGVSYRTTHLSYTGADNFAFTSLVAAEGFFKLTGAINVMPGDDWPGYVLPDGGVFVNAHSKCATGLLVHEIVHAYGGPAGLLGEGLTDWFTLDLMKAWNKPYNGNPAYGYNVSLVDRLVAKAGKERVARMVFGNAAALAGLKVQKATGRMIMGKPQTMTINWSKVLSAQADVTSKALGAQVATMTDLGYTEATMATTVPKPATSAHEVTTGLPGAIDALAGYLTDLLP
jgi:hypothetical protein